MKVFIPAAFSQLVLGVDLMPNSSSIKQHWLSETALTSS